MNYTLGKGYRYLKVEPAMSFTEIGKALGITKQAAFLTYARAIAKMRRQFVDQDRSFELKRGRKAR